MIISNDDDDDGDDNENNDKNDDDIKMVTMCVCATKCEWKSG